MMERVFSEALATEGTDRVHREILPFAIDETTPTSAGLS